jgi:hypothetical protein
MSSSVIPGTAFESDALDTAMGCKMHVCAGADRMQTSQQQNRSTETESVRRLIRLADVDFVRSFAPEFIFPPRCSLLPFTRP